MAEKERPLYTLYKGLKANNFDVPDNYDSFERTLTEAGNGGANSRHTLYNSLKEQNFDVPDTYERFYSNLFTPVNKNTSRALGGAAPMSAADKARFSAGAAAISAQAGQAMRRAKNTQRAAKLKQQQEKQRNDFGRVNLGTQKTPYGTDNAVKDNFGVDPVTGKAGTYITSSGEEIGNEYEAGQQQQAEDKFNDAYNAAVDSGAIPSAFDVVDKDGNYDLYENVGKNGVHVTEQGEQNQLDAKIADAYRRKQEIIDSLSNIFDTMKTGGNLDERMKLMNAKSQVEDEIRSLEAVRNQGDRNILQNGWQGFKDATFKQSAWDFGINEFQTMGQMELIKSKLDNGIPLTKEEQMIAQSKIGADAAAALADKEMGNAYRWANIAGQSAPFMLDFLLTGGFGGVTKAMERGAAKVASKYAMGTLGKNILKYTGIVAGDVLGSYAMAGTEQAFKTGADIMNRHMGTLYQDEDGNYKFGTFDDNGNLIHDGGEDFGKALYKGLTAAMIENYTEKLFGHNYGLKSGVMKFMEKHGMARTADFFKKIGTNGWYKGTKEWMGKFGINGLAEEIAEEEVGIPLNAWLVGDNKMSDIADGQQQLDILFGVGLSVGAMYAMSPRTIAKAYNITKGGASKIYGVSQYYRFKNAMGNVDSRLQSMMGDRWAAWKDKIDNTPNEKMGALTKEILQQKQSGSLNEEEINTIGDYISNLAKVRGYNLAKTTEVEAKEQTGEETTPEDEQQQEQEQAYAEGQDAEGEEKHEIQMQTAEAEGVLTSMLGVSEDQLESIDLDSMLGENDDLDLAIYDYQNSQARYQGVMDNAQSKVDAAEQNAIAEVRRRTDTSRGTVRNATVKSASNDLNGGEDYAVFIVSGNLAQNEDGTINTADSDQMILYFDPLTGKIEHGDASRFASLGEEVDAALATQQAIELAKQDAIAGVTRDIDGKIGEGSRFVVTDNQGQQHVYEVLADNGDGTASISIDGNVMENVFPSFDELQKMKDDSDKQRIANTVATKQAEREEQQAAEEQKKQEAEEKVKTIDWSQLIDPNGTITTATIEGEEGKNAFVVGYTPSGKLRIAYLNEDNTVEKRKGLVSPDKVMQGEPMALDEYKDIFGDSLMEQSTNSEVVDESATKEVEGSGLVDEAPIEENEPEPIGTGVFGNIYNQFKGKVKDAFNFLMKHKSGDLLGVFHRDDVGDIDLVWGNENMGLSHIIGKHVGEGKDFSTVDDALAKMDEVIKDGSIIQETDNRYVINKDGFRVAIRKNFDGKEKKWIVSAVDYNRSKEEKGITTNPTSASHGASEPELAALNDSEDKDNKNPSNNNEEKQTLTFADGTPVPMLEDGNPDFSKMTAEQAAELYDSQFGEDAEQILSNSVADAKKVLDKAKGKPIKGKTFLEQKASKDANDKAVAEAQAAYDNAKAVSNAYQEMLIDRSLGTVEGRQNLLDKAKRKYDRLKNTEEWKDNQQVLWDDTVGKVLHRLYDNTSVDVFDPEPRTVEEYVSSNLAPFSLNYEGTKTAKGVKQETGLERKVFAKSKVLAAEGKGQTVDAFVHKLWQNRPPQLESATDQDIRNAVIGLITGNMNAYDMRHVIESNRIAEAEKEIEDEQTAAENAAYQEEQRKADEEAAATAENNTPVEEVPEEETAPTDSEEQQNEQQPEDTANNMPFGEQLPESELPFSPNDENKVVGSKERKEMVDKNKVTVDHVSEAFIPKKLQRGIARIAKMMPKVNGKPLTVQYLYSADADGWFDRDTNTLYLALDSSKALQMVFGHEMTHAIKSMNTSSYDELKGLVKEFLGEDFDKAVDATEQFYNAHGVTYPNREDYEEEVIADGIGAIINDLNLTKGIALRMSHPLLAAIHNVLMKIRLAFRLSDDGIYERLTNAVKVIEKAYVDTMKMDAANVETTTGEQGTAFSIRQKPDPEKTIKCYKLMRLGEDGKLYPLFIDAKAPTELGIWYDGDSPNLEQLKGLPSGVHLVDNETGKVTSFEDWYNAHTDLYKKGNGNITKMGKLPSKEAINWATLHNSRFMYIEDTKRGQNRFGGEARKYWNLGINGSGTVSTFSMRPGWHAGSLPTMRQIGKGKEKNLRDDNFVWVEGEISADIDYNEEAQKNPDKDIPNRIPEDGYYLKATNANKSASQADRVGWYVAGAFKANRIMGDAEARKVIDDWNANHPDLPVEYDYERESGMTFNADTMRLEDKDGNPSPKFSLKVYHGSGADFDEFDFDHMGEGAGSQAFGWGGYVTSSKNIGKSYATLMDDYPSRSNVVIRNASARRFIKKYPTLESFLHSMADKDNLTAQEKNINKYFTEQEKIDYYNERAKDAEPYHNIYEVEIPDDNGKNYLEWDKPMTQEQQDIVIGGLESMGIPVTNGFEFELPFHEVYHTVLGMMLRGYGETGGIQKKASKFLSSLGFTGIKYPAGTIMGGAKKGDTNYVIFKPEDMNIASHTKFSIRTYHGSQASFDKFDHSFMGSGEGAQAYGWGTYVSEVEGIAKAYAKQNARKHNYKSQAIVEQARENYNYAKRDVDDTQYDLNITKDLLKQFQDKLENAKKNNRQNWIKEFEQRVQSSKEDIAKMEENLKKYQEVLAEKKKELDDAMSNNATYDDVERDLSDAQSRLRNRANELKDVKSYLALMKKKQSDAQKKLDEARSSGTDLGVDSLEYDVNYYTNQVNEFGKRQDYIQNEVNEAQGKVDALQKKLDSMEKPRNLYTVEIPDDTGDNYIDWDGKYSGDELYSMLDKIGNVLKSKGYDLDKEYNGSASWNDWVSRMRDTGENWEANTALGSEIYNKLSRMLSDNVYIEDQKAASLMLKDAGFDGVKVIAQRNTGGNKNGRMNYVIFDEGNAKIVNHTKFSLRGENFSSRLKSAISETDVNPSEAQKQSGNYKKGHIKFGGYNFTIENPKGSERKGVDEDGKEWSVKMHDTYGYIRGKIGKDGDHLDMFINDSADLDNWNGNVYVVDQVNDDGSFDEHKVMYGYNSEADAKKAYLANYSKGWKGLGKITGVDKGTFDKWIQSSDRKTKPFADYSLIRNADSDIRFSLRDEQIHSEQFKDWFGDWEKDPKNASKVVDENGEPLVVYHGTTNDETKRVWNEKAKSYDTSHEPFTVFKREVDGLPNSGLFFNSSENNAYEYGYNNYAVYLNVRNPLVIDCKGSLYNSIRHDGKTMDTYDWANWAEENGYDGVIFKNIKDGVDYGSMQDTTDDYVVFKSNQIKSATDNNGDFSSENNDIRFSLKDPDKTMFGMHNISVDKLRKAIKQGGFAAPSMGVVDSKNGVYSDYGEITLIPKAEKLDKRKGKNAGTFTADAWTPTYPQVIMRQTKEGKEKLYTDTMLNDNIPKELGKSLLNRWESYINTGSSRPNEFAWQYMFEKGMNPKVTYSKSAYPKSISNKVMKITDNGVKRKNELTKKENGELIKLYNAYLEKKGEGLDDNAVKEIIDYLEEWKANEKVGAFKQSLQRKIDYFKEYGGDINKAQDWAWQDVIPAAKSDGKVNHAMTLYYATIKADSDKKMQADLQKWFDGKLQEYSMEEYLYNGETASGKPKYVPNTVENAVKIMKKQGLAGGYNDFAPGVGAFIAKYAPTANTLAAMKKNKDKLIPSGDERHKEVRDMILDGYNDLARRLTINLSDAFDDSGTYRMQELADVKPKDLKKYIADNWNKEVSDGWVDGYNDLVDIIKNDYPVYYFETKFMRPYGLDEFEKAIVPKNTPTDVMDVLKKAGIDVHTYEGKEDREKVTMDAVTGSDGIMFSLKSMADGSEYAHTSLANKLGELTSAKKVDDAVKEAVDNMPSGWKMANKKAIHVAEALADNRKNEIAGNAPRFLLRPNTLIKAGTYFSGGGLVEEGLKGIIDPVLAVEYDEKISGVYRNNFGKHIVTADVRDVDPGKLVSQIDGEVEYFHASPVCKNYSNAKLRHEELELDKETAQSTADFINQVKPRVVTIENVKGYKDSEAMKIITDALDKNGYKWDADVYNAADYGGYTNRERLIVRALRDGELPEKPKKLARKSGWYEAVEDIMPTLTEKKNGVAPWMDTRLKADGIDWRNIDKPLYVMGSAYADGKVPHAFADELLPTLRTKSGDVIIMPDGKVYRAQGRVLARVSGMSDDYKLPYSESLAHTIIGNGIPTQLTEHVIAPLLVTDNPKFSIRTYHGTGAKFDNFDLSHAFEGEGSETFGHGVYVTNSGEIGTDYAKRAKGKLSNNASFTVNMGSPLANDWFKYFYRMVGNEGFDDAKKYVLDEFDQDINMYSSALEGLQADDRTRKRKEATLEEMKRLRKQIANTKEEDLPEMPHSYRYDVEIPDDNGHNYLYWFAEPSKEVQERILEGFYGLPTSTLDRMAQKDASFRALLYDIVKNVDKKQAIPALVRSNTLTQKSMYDTTDMENNVGSMYRRFANWFGGADKVSDFLSSLGYTGIKYPAGTIHSGAKEGDYNYVIFNEADARIVGNTKFSLRYSDYEKSLSDWKKRNGLPKDAKQPEMPQQLPNESKFDYMKRVNRYLGEKALWKTAPTYEGHLLFSDTAVGYLNSELQRGSVLARIAIQDSMLAVRKAQEGIMKELGLDKIGVGEDAYTAENRSHGKGKNEFEEYNQIYLQPLRKAYHAMKKLLGDSYDNVKVYMMSKHGLERNAFIAFREALKKDFTTKEKGKKDVFDASGMQKAYNDYKADINRINNDADYAAGKIDYATYRQNDDAIRTKYAPSYPEYRYDDEGNVRDYAGLSALYSEADDFEIAAAANVKDVEDAHNAEAAALWDATNASTKKILKDSHLAGMMSKSVYDYVKGMYNNYIPLRGWDGTSADQVWDYVGGGRGAFNQAMKKAEGRKSIADDPIAYIENMAESGILLNNKNWVKQHLLLLAENHPTSMLSVSKAWYVKSRDAQGNEIWTISSPNIPSDMTDPEKISQAIAQFDNDMRTLEAMGEATQKRGHLDIVYPQTKGEEREHEVRVLRDGEEYVIYVNGDPQLAQAMNNVRAQRVRENQTGLFDRTAAWIGRKMAAAYTSLSPLFIPSNFTRDLTMTLASTAIREDGRYNYLLRKNFLKNWNTMPLVIKYQNGKLKQKVEDGSATESEKMFYEFMMNGGETGFVTTMEVEDFKKKIQNELKDMDRWKVNPKRVGHAIMDSIELLNRAIEDSNRYLVYMTSRQYGRPIEEAINNAKDVTLNFNRKGTGEYGWQVLRNLYLFINPAIQSLQTLGALAKNHPYKFTAVTSLWLASGALVPIVNSLLMSMFGDDDDKDKYWSFSKWDRRNNFIMWFPGTKNFVKIPLAQEFRGFYAVGDMIASKLMGGEKAEESWSDYAADLAGQIVDMLPLDPTGYDGEFIVSIFPNALRPILELAFNVDFTGKPLFNDSEYNKYDPNFTKAYVGTPDWLVRTSKLVNSINNPYPDVQQNAIDRFGNPRYNLNNPAVVDHVLSSYLGGAYTFGSQAVGVLTKALNADSEIKVADIPLLSRFAANPDDRPVSKKQGDAFWTMKEQQDRTANTLSKLKKEAKVSGDFSTLEGFYKSDQYAKFKENAPRIKQYEEDKKKEKAEKDGEEYKAHKVTGSDIYKKHASSSDDFEDMKLDLLWKKVGSYKTVYDGMVSVGNSQSESYYGNHAAAIDAADEAYNLRSDINGLKKGMITDDGKDGYNADDMKQIRELRKQAISILENAAKSLPKPEDK